MESTHPVVILGTRGGEVEVPVIGQPHAYLVHVLETYLQRAGSLEVLGALLDGAGPAEALGLLRTAGDGLIYDLLEQLLPELPVGMAKHQFAGYRTIDAFERGEYDPAQDRSPSFGQIEEAFKVAARVNRLDVLKTLFGAVKGLIDPKDLAELKAGVSGWITSTLREFEFSSPSSPGTNGAAHQSGSGDPLPTDAAGAGKPAGETEAGAIPADSSGPLLTI